MRLTLTSMFSAQSARNFLLEQRIMRKSGTSLRCSPVAPFHVGRKPGSGGVKCGSLAAVYTRSKRCCGKTCSSRGLQGVSGDKIKKCEELPTAPTGLTCASC